jgi:hypothetical protein
MPRIEITHETDWSAEYEIDDDGFVSALLHCTVDGEPIPWVHIPLTVDKLLCDAARAAEAQRLRDLPGEIADMKLLERKDGER